ncbi:MAG: DUF1015 domain-containing protein [Thermodesulfobacteriota bacterium]
MKTVFEKPALCLPEVYLPSKNTDPVKWSVIACDQYTSQPDYWEKTAEFVGDNPSSLNIILPEVFLGTEREKILTDHIHESMNEYLKDNTLVKQGPGIFLCEREVSGGRTRKGMLCCLDLEHYDYSKNSKSLIRPTEGTIVERIPPRIKVRQQASLETPHIMVLIDDPEKKVIEPLFKDETKKKLYDFNLMNNSGNIKGYMIDNEEAANTMTKNLTSLIEPENYKKRYNLDSEKNPLLYAMGDGNHSFATAKAWWEKIKNENKDDKSIMDHPARWALVEIVNIHDESIDFEPIHRIIFNTDPDKILNDFVSFFEQRGSVVEIEETKNLEEVIKDDPDFHKISFCFSEKTGIIKIKKPMRNIAAGDLQDALNNLSSKEPELKIDYIHGKNHLEELCSEKGNIGFLLPPVSKDSFFKSIIMDGALPRKSFSMGEADDKRFYMECRKIVK